ncbi:hypothetical protein Knedl_CDS0021 [Pseudomonas phage Knedl]|nr:hypothetical protein Knedl_CDS0021 [Pseudomonas phage Knedl]
MNQLAETIKLGMFRALQTEQLRHMCVHVMAVADHRGISYTDAFNFMYWVERAIGPYKDAMQYLCQHHPELEMERRKMFGTDEERRRPMLSSMGASQRPALVGFVSLVLGVLLSIAASQLVVIAMLGWY